MVIRTKTTLVLILTVAMSLGLGTLSLAAEQTLSANDLTPGTITAPLSVDTFVVTARADKTVVVEALTTAKTAPDGEIFNARIKLGGAGASDFRSISLSATAAATVKVYCNSSSKTDARILKLVDEAGTVVAELGAPVDEEPTAGLVTANLPKAGKYFLFSAGSGINLYQVVVQ